MPNASSFFFFFLTCSPDFSFFLDDFDDEYIFPYAQSRVGGLHQVANLSGEPNAAGSVRIGAKKVREKTEKEVLKWSPPATVSPQELDTYFQQAKQVHEKSSDVQMTEALNILHEHAYNFEAALAELRRRPKKLTAMESWTAAEKQTFAEGIKRFGKEPNLIKSLFPKKSTKQVVNYFYFWKQTPEARELKKKKHELDDDHVHFKSFPAMAPHLSADTPSKSSHILKPATTPKQSAGGQGSEPGSGQETANPTVIEPPHHHPTAEKEPQVFATIEVVIPVVPAEEPQSVPCENCTTPTVLRKIVGPHSEVLCQDCGITWKRLGFLAGLYEKERLRIAVAIEENKAGGDKERESSAEKGRSKKEKEHEKEPKEKETKERAPPKERPPPKDRESKDRWKEHAKEAKEKGKEKEKDKRKDPEKRKGQDDKEDGGRRKKAKVEEHLRIPACAVCLENKMTEDNAIFTCAQCSLHVHQGCFGIPKGTIPKTWECHKCQNDLDPEVLKNYHCIFCPPKRYVPTHVPETPDQPNLRGRMAALRGDSPEAIKQTIEKNWAHVVCAMWIPEVKFGDSALLEPIENVGKIPKSRWKLVRSPPFPIHHISLLTFSSFLLLLLLATDMQPL